MTTLVDFLPAEIQDIVLDKFLDKVFDEPLQANLGFRAIAERVSVQGEVGDTLTKSRPALLAPITATTTPTAYTDVENGMTPQTYPIEQYKLTLGEYKGNTKTNVVYDRLAIGSKFARDAARLGLQAAQSLDGAARDALFDVYQGGNSRATGAVSNSSVVSVDDTRGFTAGDVIMVGDAQRTVVSVAHTGSSTAYRGVAGTITVDSSITSEASGSPVFSLTAPLILRSNSVVSTNLVTGKMTADMILDGVAQHDANGIPRLDGLFNLYISSKQARGLYNDPMFKDYFVGAHNSDEYKDGIISELLGVRLIRTNMNPTTAGGVYLSALVGADALIEGSFTETGYAGLAAAGLGNDLITVHDGIAHIIGVPRDNLYQWVTQSWTAVVGYGVPTDKYTTAAVLPTASNAAFKRAIIMESK